jgi:hypothetical protein
MAMMATKDEMPDRDEIESLLPWHAAGALKPEDAARVESAIAADEVLAQRYALVREEREETVAVNEALGAPSAAAMERLFAAIERDAPRRRAPSFDFGSWVAALFSHASPRALGWVAAAAMLVIVVQAGLLTDAYLSEPQTYRVASPGDAADTQAQFAIVRFNPAATAADVARVLGEHKALIVDGPRAGGLYRIRVGEAGLSKEELFKIVSRLQEEKAVIRFVVPAQ